MNDNINQRIEEIIGFFAGGNKSKFADTLGIKSGVIHNYIGERKSKPGYEFIYKIAETYPTINMTWFITGEGEMLRTTQSDVESLKQEIQVLKEQLEDKKLIIEFLKNNNQSK